jgi:hypothetical protein
MQDYCLAALANFEKVGAGRTAMVVSHCMANMDLKNT